MKKKFRKGLLLGLAVGVFASKYLQTPEGKKKKAELKKKANALLKEAQGQLAGIEKPTRAAYNKMSKQLVNQYAKRNEIAGDVKEFLSEYLQSQWHEFEPKAKKVVKKAKKKLRSTRKVKK